MSWKQQWRRRSETAADKYNNQLIEAVEEMAKAAMAMAAAMQWAEAAATLRRR